MIDWSSNITIFVSVLKVVYAYSTFITINNFTIKLFREETSLIILCLCIFVTHLFEYLVILLYGFIHGVCIRDYEVAKNIHFETAFMKITFLYPKPVIFEISLKWHLQCIHLGSVYCILRFYWKVFTLTFYLIYFYYTKD